MSLKKSAYQRQIFVILVKYILCYSQWTQLQCHTREEEKQLRVYFGYRKYKWSMYKLQRFDLDLAD